MGTSCRQGRPPLLDSAVPVAGDGGNDIIPRDVERKWLCSTQRSRGEHGSVTLAEDQGVKLSQPRCKTDTASMLPAHSIFARPVMLEML